MSRITSIDDVFISYAHIDNVPARGVRHGWVSNLHYGLERALARQLGGQCSIWFDQSELRGHHAVTPAIVDKLASVSTFVAVLTAGYLQSEWCRKELEVFLSRFPTMPSGRLFVVDVASLAREERRGLGIGDLTTYRFWFRDEAKRVRTYGAPEPRPDELEYYRLVDDLATDIADALKASDPRFDRSLAARPVRRTLAEPAGVAIAPVATLMSPAPANGLLAGPADPVEPAALIPGAAPAPDPAQRPILIGEVTDDLVPVRRQLLRYLEQAELPVQVADSYGLSADAFTHALRSNLQNAGLFVQLLSQVPSRPLPELPEGYASLQHRLALEGGRTLLSWRDPALAVGDVEDEGQRGLLLHESVHAVPFETFKRLVMETATAPAPEPPKLGGNPFVFINAEKSDLNLAEQIKSYIGRYAAAFLPVNEGKPEEIRRDTEENIVDCDGLLVVYGDGSAAWVRQQLRLYNKLAPQREKPIKLLALVEAPPDSKPEINVQIPGMRILNCRAGLNEAELAKVLASLTKGPPQ